MKENPIRRMLDRFNPGGSRAVFQTAALGLGLLIAPAAHSQPAVLGAGLPGPGSSPPGGAPAGGLPPPGGLGRPWDRPENADLRPVMPAGVDVGPTAKSALTDLVPPLPPGLPEPSPDPHNLEGAWVHDQMLSFMVDHDMYENPPPYTPRVRKLLARRLAAQKAGKPYSNAAAKCRPPGLLWQQAINYPFLAVQTKDRLELIYHDYHGRQTVLLDPAKAPKTDRKDYMGLSIGRWVGDTLVVETKGFKIATWLDAVGTPASADAVFTQRIRKVKQGHWFLEIITTIDDPIYYSRPWSVVATFAWRPDMEILKEYDCETQVGDKSVDVDAGLNVEPPEEVQ